MSFIDKLNTFYSENPYELEGVNLEPTKVNGVHALSEAMHQIEYSPRQIEILKKFDQEVFEAFDYSQTDDFKKQLSPLPIENGKVVLTKENILHNLLSNMDRLRSISQSGILASEYFGIPESFRECPLCTSLSTLDIHEQRQLTFKSNKCMLVFDHKHPLMKELVRLNFFEYEHLRRHEPDKLQQVYNIDKSDGKLGVAELFDEVIAPQVKSNCPPIDMRNTHYTNEYDSWIAIPGGVPSGLVTGIRIHSKDTDLNQKINEISELFPSAVIFDENQKVLHLPKTKKQTDESECE